LAWNDAPHATLCAKIDIDLYLSFYRKLQSHILEESCYLYAILVKEGYVWVPHPITLPLRDRVGAGGIPQNNQVLNQVYADVLGKPILVPAGIPTSLGSGIFALLAAKAFSSIEEAQAKMCLSYKIFSPHPSAHATYNRLFKHYRKLYFALGKRGAEAADLGDVLPELRKIAAEAARKA